MYHLMIAMLCLIAAAFRIHQEPRRFSNAVLLSYGCIKLVNGLMEVWEKAAPGLAPIGDGEYAVTFSGEMRFLLILLYGLFFLLLGIGLIISGIRLLRKERLCLTHVLPVGFGFFSLLYIFIQLWVPRGSEESSRAMLIWIYVYRFLRSIAMYLPFMLFAYVLYSLVYKVIRGKHKPDYIIVLGARIIGDRVSPLVAARLDKGLEIYRKYKGMPKFVVSGGQGSDEVCSEADAMARYLVDKGIPEEQILREDRSVNTMENLKFSKRRIEKDTDGAYNCAIVTNNFHMLRAAIYARAAGIPGSSCGCRTAMYYLPAAALREFIAFVFSYKGLALCVILHAFVVNLVMLIRSL